MPPLAIVLVSDGKPGHFNLAEGICAAIARRCTTTTTRVPVARPWWLPTRGLSALSNAGGAAARAAPGMVGLDCKTISACDLVVSAGGDTLAANVALARHFGCPNIFYGSLRRYRPQDFALVLTSYAANAGRPNHAMTLKPSAFDPGSLPARSWPAEGSGATFGLLVGGDSGTVRYTSVDWQRLLGLPTRTAPGDPRWIVANSRRTPALVSDAIARLAAREPDAIRFIDVRRAGSGTLAALFAGCDAVAVTIDSSSMVSEAIWAGRPAVALSPVQATLPALEQGYRDHLAANGWLATLPLAAATPASLLSCLGTVRPLRSNPLDSLGDLIADRLPAVFAPVNCPP